ncbi:transglycosylase domain-containing protein [Streptomyces sp. NPDC006879]|uniref:transglycosylase domain-containing protein n=1 Tax=Streptomyces sp. NPDC006879 TaxID=3364767 RepID=UPI003682407B
MSEHRRKPQQSGGRAAARRAAQPPRTGRRAEPGRDVPTGSPSGPYGSSPGPYGHQASPGQEQPYGGRAEARRAAQRGGAGRRRGAEPGRGRKTPDKRFINYPRSDQDGWKRFMPSWKLVSGTLFGFFAILLAGTGIAFAMVGTPNANAMAQAQNNVFYWSDGTQMAATGGQRNRQNVTIDQIPRTMQDAVIAAENETFRDDHGVDPKGIARAVVNMLRGQSTQGGSTITQQYVKNTYLEQDQTIKRKVTELFISIKLGATADKNDILAGYLNTAYFGRGAYGIQAAAQAYFKVDSNKLDPSQSAFLANLLKGPNLYNPDGGIGSAATPEANTKRAQARWKWILDREVKVGLMTPDERAKHQEFPQLAPSTEAQSLAGQTGYLVETAKSYVMKAKNLDIKDLELGGYRIYTTFDKKKVNALAKAVDKTREDFLNPERRDEDRFVQFGAASVDPSNGAIVALYGGAGMDKKHFSNNANTTGVPVGSTWKPYVLAAAMEYGTQNSDGGISQDSKYNGNDLIVIKNRFGDPVMGNDGKPFRQKNEGTTRYGYVTLTKAMEDSINTPFVQLGFDVGHDKIRKVAESTGILKESMDPNNNASFALGTSTPSAIRMADSYATFAASGTHHEPYSVKEVRKDGIKLTGFGKPESQRAMDNSIADNITKVLENVVENGTGTKARKLGRPAAGKTGTTDKNKSAWFVGYTPQLSTAVTLFRTDPNSKDKELLSMNNTGGVPSIHGGDIPAEIWTEYMKAALKGQPVEDFPEAEDIGERADSLGAPSPTPSKSLEPKESPTTEEPEESPEPSPSRSSAKPRPSCKPWKWDCGDAGGTDEGAVAGTDEGADGDAIGGPSSSPTPTSTRSARPSRPGSDSGGLIGGPTEDQP